VYTQCSKCETVFKLSAEVLRTAGGQVRCGKCGEVFSALARLAEDSSAFVVGESAFELETRADSILGSTETPAVARTVAKDYEEFAPPGVEIARLEVMDWSEEDRAEHAAAEEDIDGDDDGLDPATGDASDRSLEFTLPPGELDRIFVEFKKRGPRTPLVPEVTEVTEVSEAAAPTDESEPPPVHPLPPPPPPPAPMPQPLRVIPDLDYGLEPAGIIDYGAEGAAQRRHYRAWLGAAGAAALLLIGQMVHHNRDWFVAHAQGPGGGLIRAWYGVPAPANLSAYQLRQWGVTGDPDANGTLRLRASILNTAALLQPYPLLRVTLADRFGKSIGRREFEPAEYMGKPTAKLLAPGERVDATLAILDPGKNAEGFEIDVCLRGVERRISCANDAPPQSKK
jgi:predicted Zn finger-like uncharacterized protein